VPGTIKGMLSSLWRLDFNLGVVHGARSVLGAIVCMYSLSQSDSPSMPIKEGFKFSQPSDSQYWTTDYLSALTADSFSSYFLVFSSLFFYTFTDEQFACSIWQYAHQRAVLHIQCTLCMVVVPPLQPNTTDAFIVCVVWRKYRNWDIPIDQLKQLVPERIV